MNCAHKAISCNVIFSLEYQIGGAAVRSLGHWNEAYEGKFYPIDLDLSALAGNNVKFILRVTTNGPFNQDRAVWVGPRIARLGSPPNTARRPRPRPLRRRASPLRPRQRQAQRRPPPRLPTATSTPTETPTATPTP